MTIRPVAVTTDIADATRNFERWLRGHIRLRRDDLDYKHAMMAADTFSFLRATCYRWAQLWPEALPELAEAPRVLSVGDLHVENFGTWRDVEGRLVWGINDFDEAARLPYTSDLVRLATSAGLAAAEGHLNLDLKQACAAILAGYTASLRAGGKAMVLAENDRWLRKMATGRLRDPIAFWARMQALPTARGPLASNVQSLLLRRIPDGAGRVRFVRRRSGLGSLGHERLVAIAEWHGSAVAHEAEALAPSAWEWAHKEQGGSGRILYLDLMASAVRCPDPLVEVREGWLIRRLSPDCSRIEVDSLPKPRDDGRLLKAMGWETGNVHLASPAARKAILADLKRRRGWLREAATKMGRLVRADWKEWRATARKPSA
jgi:hypothetical protein